MIVKSTLLFGASGSFEEVTIKKWKRLRVAAHKSAGNMSNISQRTRDQQTAYRLLVALWKKIAPVVYYGYVDKKSFPGEFAAWMSYNSRNAVDFSTPGSPVLIPANIRISSGPIAAQQLDPIEVGSAETQIVIFWTNENLYRQGGLDRIGAIAYNITKDIWLTEGTFGYRDGGASGINLSPGQISASDQLIVYTFFFDQPYAAVELLPTKHSSVQVNQNVTVGP